MDYQFHPLRDDDPLPTEGEIRARMKDIKEHGLEHPIILFRGQILVGRTDYLACERLGIEPRFVVTYLSKPKAFVIAARAQRGQQALPTHRVVSLTPAQIRNREHEQLQHGSSVTNGSKSKRVKQQRQQQLVGARKQIHSTAVRHNVRNLASRIGIRAAARQYGLKESRVLNWAWRDGWHIGKRKRRLHNPVNRCPSCGQPVVSI